MWVHIPRAGGDRGGRERGGRDDARCGMRAPDGRSRARAAPPARPHVPEKTARDRLSAGLSGAHGGSPGSPRRTPRGPRSRRAALPPQSNADRHASPGMSQAGSLSWGRSMTLTPIGVDGRARLKSEREHRSLGAAIVPGQRRLGGGASAIPAPPSRQKTGGRRERGPARRVDLEHAAAEVRQARMRERRI